MAWGKPDKNGKREPMGARTSYMRELCFERLAKKSKHNVSSASMKWGHIEEQKAQDAYEMLTGNIVQPSEFIVHPKYDWLGCSPDGLINDDGGTESKCPFNEAIGDLGLYKCNGYKPMHRGGQVYAITATFEQTFHP
jgi:hypothetical protein